MAGIQPFFIPVPQKLLQDKDPSIGDYFTQLNRFTYEVFVFLGEGGDVVGIVNGGTGANNAADARVNLGVEIGVDVQGYSVYLDEAITFFTSTDITGAEAETLIDGSNADSLHAHAHNTTTGLQGGTTNEYCHLTSAQHTEITTFFASTDISAAEAETLTDGSDAIGLHTHDQEIAARIALRC